VDLGKGARFAVPLCDFSFADITAKKHDASFTDGSLPGANFPEQEAILSSNGSVGSGAGEKEKRRMTEC
jgi:hypothetical protein